MVSWESIAHPLSNNRIKLGFVLGIAGILLTYFISTSIKSNDPIYNNTGLDINRT